MLTKYQQSYWRSLSTKYYWDESHEQEDIAIEILRVIDEMMTHNMQILYTCVNQRLTSVRNIWATLMAKSMFEQPATFVQQSTKLYTAFWRTWAPRATLSRDSKGYVHVLMSWELPLIVYTTSEVLCEVQCSLKWLYWEVHIKHKQNFCWHVES